MRITTVGSFAIAVAGHTVSVSSASSPTSVPGPAMNCLPSQRRARLQQQRAFLHDIAAIGEFAGVEQHRAAWQVLGFRADREDAQRLLAEHREGGHLLEEGDVVFEGHGSILVSLRVIASEDRSRNDGINVAHGTSL